MGMVIVPIFDKELNKVLLCHHKKFGIYNFVGGHIKELEEPLYASYRELKEETGITKDDVELKFVRFEQCSTWEGDAWQLYTFCGVLDHDVTLVEEENPLVWVSTKAEEELATYGFDGDVAVYVKRCLHMLQST